MGEMSEEIDIGRVPFLHAPLHGNGSVLCVDTAFIV